MLDKKSLDNVVSAKRTLVEGQVTIWNVRLEALARVGDIRGLLDHLISPVATDTDNCKCNVNCGGGGCDPADLGLDTVQQRSVAATLRSE